jgi:hypothetical protein
VWEQEEIGSTHDADDETARSNSGTKQRDEE